jgi:anti-sigma regulatory factor (Ser/Thr protein kinase)
MTDLNMQLRADDSAPRLSRVQLDEIADELGSRLIDVKLVVSELVSNSVRHANTHEGVQVRVRVDDDKIRVEVVDDGPGFTLDSKKDDGLGLTIVKRLAQDWGISVDSTCTVWVEMTKSIAEEAD